MIFVGDINKKLEIINKDLDLTEILKDCPNGIKLYSPIFGDVYLDKIRPYLAVIVTTNKEQNGLKEEFLYDGRYGINGECMIFPSKEQRDWSKWHRPFVDGDVLSYQNKLYKNRTIYIYRHHSKMNTSYYVALSASNDFMIGKDGDALNNYNDTARFATEEEKVKLFYTIKANGYKWNADTKTLEKIKKEKFDPKTLKPFESKVLVSTFSSWKPAIFGAYIKELAFPIVVVGGNTYTKCIPYEESEHLIGTHDQQSEFYRYWED